MLAALFSRVGSGESTYRADTVFRYGEGVRSGIVCEPDAYQFESRKIMYYK